MESRKVPLRRDGRVIVHFDYDCFYAAVFEAKTPSLKSLPFAVQQKQIIVTCNYEARRRGLHKLQLIKDARRICPDVIIELGEDISRFRDASKELYKFIKAYSWNGKVERLGFDEVWMDVTDIIDYNIGIINRHDLQHSFFQMVKDDPTVGFEFDATTIAGHSYPKSSAQSSEMAVDSGELSLRLCLGSHVALYMRHQLEQHKGYTSTVGIATSKLLSKLVGNMNKPKGQTTLMSADSSGDLDSSAMSFVDAHEIGKVPGIGFKLAQRLRDFVLNRAPEKERPFEAPREPVTVAQVRQHPDIDYEKLEKLLAGPGSAHGIGFKIWCLLHGVDDSEVSQARAVPRQISIEDSYIRLDTMPELLKELNALARSLITRMRVDLLSSDDELDDPGENTEDNAVSARMSLVGMKWLAHPKTLRLTTRPRQPLQPDGTRPRTMKRISHSCPLPNFVFLLNESVDILAEKLVRDSLLTMFRKLHPEKTWWNLSLVNLAVTNMAETASNSKSASGRDIGNMFKRQEDVLKDFRVTDVEPLALSIPENAIKDFATTADGSMPTTTEDEEDGGGWTEDMKDFKAIVRKSSAGHLSDLEDADGDATTTALGNVPTSIEDDGEGEGWVDDDGMDTATDYCRICSSSIPTFAMVAHQRFHSRMVP